MIAVKNIGACFNLRFCILNKYTTTTNSQQQYMPKNNPCNKLTIATSVVHEIIVGENDIMTDSTTGKIRRTENTEKEEAETICFIAGCILEIADSIAQIY